MPRAAAFLLRHAMLILGSLAMLYPVLWMLAGSVRPENEIFHATSIIPSSVHFSAYLRGWNGLQVSLGRFFWNSFVIAAVVTLGNVLSCSLTAFAFARLRFALRGTWFAVMLGTLMLPYQVVLIPQYVLFLHLGWVNTIAPLTVPKYFAVDAFFVFMMVQFFRGLPRELDEAAVIDGCGPWRLYWNIVLPLSRPVLATAAIFSFLFTWDDFFGPLIYLNDIGSYTVQLGLRSFIDSTGTSDWGGLFAMSCLCLVPVFLVFICFQKLLVEGIATTGMKR